MKNLLALRPYLFRYRKSLAAGIVCVVATNFFAVAAPRFLGEAIDLMGKPFEMREILHKTGLYILFAALSGILLYLVRQLIIVTSRHIEFDLKNDYYSHLQTLSTSFYDSIGSGELISRGTNDLNAIRDFLGPGIMYSINTLFRLLFAIVAMLSISPLLTLFALLPAPFLSWSVYKTGVSLQHQSKKIQENYASITNLVQENISGIRVVRNYNREEWETSRFEALNREYYDKNLRLGRIQAGFMAVLTAMTALSLIPVIWAGGLGVMKGTMSIGNIAQFVIYVTMLSWPIISIGWVTNIIQKAAAAQGRLDEIFDTKPEIVEPASGQATETKRPLKGELTFEHVGFAYPSQPDREVLRDISFTVEPGTKLAIVGATGSGKSTLVNLIPRLYDPTSGRITIARRDIKTLSLGAIRRTIGFVPQSNFLFSDTIRNNIDFGSNGDGIDVIEASRIAMLHDDVEDFPDGFDTMLGEKGINLSGGQKQRACIARALRWQPSILVLDDALSAVDTATEASIFDGLLQKLPDTTIVLISHRISTVRNCDRIIVLHDGAIAESGTHEELLENGRYYADLYMQQMLEEEISALS
ncbi:ABC transporter ATP-binding protein [Chlorobaculum thiosulfatiphilum]|uniref:ABC transporter ATP-binding protein n=1 Tax=Chlorobaculum thiosulfatiphilum TaxID=115852 RepID=A0A5C4S5Q3_CHLTI|nr:ABC transporter ATP-binding protein [Chlorobaculum thiosulfatiphilum]TNJ38359.1 ABC transporter ATP-binding protein [Chlorobaculum thiosulfatiphilum]